MKTRRLRATMRRASLPVALAAALASGHAAAQDAAPSADATTLDRIEVTGSRIRKAEVETAQPILTMSREDIQKQGFNSVFDILQNLTSSGSPNISRADALAGGENVGGYYIDMRNLGAPRVLILLNGKRLGVSTDGLQDLSQIPFSAIQRIEVLKDGASSIYGSDAITGVVNVITRSHFDGAEANAYFGTYDEGDGSKQSYDVTVGATGERVAVTFSAEYSKEDPVWARDRWFSAVSIPDPGYPYDGWSLVSQNGVWFFGNCDPDPVQGVPLCTLNRGSDPRNPDNYHAMDYPERANPNEQMMLQTGIERRSLFASASIDLTDAIRFRSDIGYTTRSTQQQIAGQPGQVIMSADSYFNPTPGEDILVLRRQWEMPRRNRSKLDTLRVSLGLEGAFDVGERPWDWDVNYMTNENTLNKYGTGEGSLASLDAALGASWLNPANGRVECGSADDPVPYGSNASNGECAPYNPLLPSGEPGQGSLADATL
ncbi:MAG: TonB-dependent receptor plug domain-containing protein, partial [Luteimonas sp.]|nr:TonB-dependent receptor plug domain-containing protein [Luteimonas sp.]